MATANGADGISDMAGRAARVAVEPSGSERDTMVGPGDAILIPSGTWHTIMAREPLRFLCCCAPPYSHEDTYFT
jgi:mannose-6-phosphate isomerase-like protein (cupin superfamily)